MNRLFVCCYTAGIVLLSSNTATSSLLATSAVSDSVVAACPIPDLDSIADNVSTFYNCVEEIFNCGENGYPLGIGVKYSDKFYFETRPKLSAQGQLWIDKTLICLQQEFRDRITSEASCDEVKELALRHHPDCYVQSGFCALSRRDKLKVGTTISVKDAISTKGLPTTVKIIALCSS